MADNPEPKTILDGVIAIASAVEANAVALMGAATALEELTEHFREAHDPFASASEVRH